MSRETLRTHFIQTNGWQDAQVSFLAGDASNRHYYRVAHNNKTAVLMDAFDESEAIEPFLRAANVLKKLDCSVPEIFAYDTKNRLILMEDLGDNTFTYCLKQNQERFPLYEKAVDTLIHIHKNFDISTALDLPVYDTTTMLEKASLFLEWYYPSLQETPLTRDIKEEWEEAWRDAFKILEAAPKTIILRDFHVDNLLWLEEREDYKKCGLLDFQDANIGPQAYDLVSLLEDVRQDVPRDLTQKLLSHYLEQFPQLDEESFMAQYYTLGAQRATRIIGAFARLLKRTQRDHYMQFIPRTWQWLENDLKHSNLLGVSHWFEEYFPKEKRKVLTCS